MLETRVGSYRILEKLAQGGMGEVYVAYHDLMQREAVVKMLHPKLLHDEDVVQRFLNEARAAAAIQHPGIVEIYDLGRSNGQVYIIMERLRGETLAERVAKGTLDVELTVSLCKQLASALEAAHDHDIVHRDLKPENLFVVPDRDVQHGERIKVLDFGVAKLAPEQGGMGLTAQGTIFGTPAYMAPEQCENASKVDRRSDLYAVGCIMYEMLTGQPPFGRGGLELFAAHLRDQPPPLSDFDPTIPRDLEKLVLRLLAKKPADRPQSCAELYEALETADLTPRQGTGPIKRVSTLAFAATVAPGETVPKGKGVRTPVAVASSPTTHRTATGQVEPPLEPRKKPRSRSRAVWWVAAGLLFVIGSGGAAFKIARDRSAARSAAAQSAQGLPVSPATTPATTPETAAPDPVPQPGSEFLDQAEQALGELRWEDAILAARQAAGAAPADSPVHTRATAIQESARQNQQYAWAYQVFNDAVAKDDIRAAVYAYEQMPADSIYRERATAAYDTMRESWLAPHRQKAAELVDKKRCSAIDDITREVGFMFPESSKEFADAASKCRAERKQATAEGATAEGAPAEESPPEEAPAPEPAEPVDDKMLANQVPDILIKEALATKKKIIAACAIEHALTKPAQAKLVIAPSGKLESLTIEDHDQLSACIWMEIRDLAFPAAREATVKIFTVGEKSKKPRGKSKKRTKKSGRKKAT